MTHNFRSLSKWGPARKKANAKKIDRKRSRFDDNDGISVVASDSNVLLTLHKPRSSATKKNAKQMITNQPPVPQAGYLVTAQHSNQCNSFRKLKPTMRDNLSDKSHSC